MRVTNFFAEPYDASVKRYQYARNFICRPAPEVFPMYNILPGSAEFQRIGDTVSIHSIEVRLQFETQSDTSLLQPYRVNPCRLVYVLDTQPDGSGSLPSYYDLFTNSSLVMPQISSSMSRYRVLKDVAYDFKSDPLSFQLTAVDPTTGVATTVHSNVSDRYHDTFTFSFAPPLQQTYDDATNEPVINRILLFNVNQQDPATIVTHVEQSFTVIYSDD